MISTPELPTETISSVTWTPPPQDSVLETSEEIGEISKAVSKAQSEIKLAEQDGVNPHFRSKYSTLASSLKSGRGPASKNGLAVFQGQGVSNGVLTVITILAHESGQWVKSTITVPLQKTDIQSIKSAVTYCRRMGYDGILMIASSDSDDDGNAGSEAESEDQVLAKKDGKKMRAKLNKALAGCKTMSALEKEARKIKGDTYNFWKLPTYHNDTETFGDIYLSHKDRVGNSEAQYTEEGQQKWRGTLYKTESSEDFLRMLEIFRGDSHRQTPENEQALQARAQDLGLWDEHTGTFIEGV